ncbi:putative LuxR-family transcriptional regulator [Actinoplanes missouriensis 431]|uniref:Putative LuxR-family transcriptional regulator n=1 Tax=Actinoplanes missouriensis (strain ATCC 14538 / DSM 43046 / CBS 188.64 / JCM 3121 / NBRC 102363 / NCIMB 12654 / NRRL B-3342 / UNCC 431) TaxID=512565 RepID=I0H3V1_ACTM4|nr:LuxR family transcriptional regulator [Actinoplanes missouriensis]BAL87688.1 putative LuxR-family transcriptional regulator [Actinoplanes missouriensis 431]
MPFAQLVGRDAELARAGRLLEPGGDLSLFVTGARGSGKSALLTAAAAAAREAGRRVLLLRGGDGPWPLRQLLLAIRHDLAGLPPAVKGPALAFLGLTPDAPPHLDDLPAVVRAAITAVAATTGILVVADDAHELPPAALATLSQLTAGPWVAVLTAGRMPVPEALAGFAVLELAPLGADDAARLLDDRDRMPSARDRATILHRAAGNPAALVEFSSAGSPAGGLLAEFTDALAVLPTPARTLLLYAAAAGFPAEAALLSRAAGFPADAGPPSDAADAAGGSDAAADHWLPAVESGLITRTEGLIFFGHPLAAEAAYRYASAHLRRRVHRDLAAALTDRPEHYALQLAAAEPGPDEQIATALETAAAIFRRQGLRYRATAAMQQAAERSPSPQAAARRLTQAVGDARDLRDTAWTTELHAQVWRLTDDADVLAAAARPAATAMHWAGRPDEAYAMVTAAHRAGPPANPAVAAQLALIAAQIAWVTGDEDHRRGLPTLLAAAGPDPERATAAYVREVIDPAGHAGRELLDAVVLPEPGQALLPADRQRFGLLGAIAYVEDRAPLAVALLTASVAGDPAATPSFGTLPTLVSALIDAGDWERADRFADPGPVTGLPAMRVTLAAMRAQLHALRGESEAALRLARETWERLDIQGNRAAHIRLLRAAGLASADSGDQENAYRYLRSMFDADGRPLHPHLSSRAVAELAITAVRCGQQADARTVVARVRDAAGAGPSGRITALLQLSEAVLADNDGEALFQQAVTESDYPYERALAHLHYGVWLRRHRSPREARLVLAYAGKVFEELGARGAAELAAREIAVGVQSTTSPENGPAALTPQERQVAALAAQGLSNRAIAEQLFISARTVGTHLSRVYRKTGISRRQQLGNLS